MSKGKENQDTNPEGIVEGAADQKAAPLRYVGPKPPARIGNLPGVFGTKSADNLTQEEIAFVIETSAVPNVAKWWTSD